jgi:DNA gyrase subunit A
VFELRRDAVPKVVLNNLFKYTPLQTSFSVNMVALDDGVPRTMNLRDVLVAYVAHQIEVITRRSQHRLDKAKAREHIVEGLIRAIDMIDEIIATIRASDDRAAAREALMSGTFAFSEIQANHILDMSLVSLTRLGASRLEEELTALRETIGDLEDILGNEQRLRNVISEELTEVRDDYANERRTQLTIDPGEFDIEDLIDDEELIFTLTDGGYVKTTPADEFRTQGRGGRGVKGAKLKEGDLVEVMMHTTAHAYMLFFTNQGKVYQLRAHEIPVGSRNSRGTAIVNLLQLDPDERVMAVIDTRDYETVRYLLFVTAGGIVKKTAFSAYSNIRQNGLRAVNLREGDELVRVVPISGDFDVCLVTSDGQLMRFNPEEAREMGRVASGVKGVKLKSESASVVSCAAARDDHELLVVTTNGLGKRTAFDAFGAKHRGGMGMRVMKLRDEGAEIVRAMAVLPDDEVMLIASNGVIIRTPVSEISLQGRDASGVRVMSVPDGERVVAVTLVREPEGDDDEDGEGSSEDGAAAETSADATEASTDDVAEDAATNEEAGDEEE